MIFDLYLNIKIYVVGTLITNLTAKGHNGSPVIIEPLYDFTYDTIFITTSHFGSSGTKASIFLKNPKNIDADRVCLFLFQSKSSLKGSKSIM